jgi:hypothetical protein
MTDPRALDDVGPAEISRSTSLPVSTRTISLTRSVSLSSTLPARGPTVDPNVSWLQALLSRNLGSPSPRTEGRTAVVLEANSVVVPSVVRRPE